MRKINKIMIMVLALVFCFSLAAQAALISTGQIFIQSDPGQSTETLGTFTATLEYFYDNADSSIGRLQVIGLTNTSPLVNGGFITGFVMNNPGPITSIDSISFTNANFDLLPGAAPVAMSNNGVSGSPFGDFDFGAALGGNFLGGGSPSGGIAVNASANFTFNLSDTALDALTTQSFVDALSNNPGGYNAQFFLARFRGFEDGGSDKVPGVVATPIPGSLLLMGSGLLGLIGIRRKIS